MSPPSCVIFTAGDWCTRERIDSLLKHQPTVLACDAALAACLEHGIVPNATIGDMDSVDPAVLQRFVDLGGEVHRREEQDSHDLSKAVVLAEEMGHMSCAVVGATGGDREHEWANLLTCAASTMDIECLGSHHLHRFFSNGIAHSIEIETEGQFSLFGLPSAKGVSLSGAKYGLDEATLQMGSRGLHNIAVAPTLSLRCTSGRLMLLMPHPSKKAEENS
jgi:thiamine pyrophosphokinase